MNEHQQLSPMDNKSQQLTLDQWCAAHAPDLGRKLTAIVDEWNLGEGDKDRCVLHLLQTIRENIK